MLCNVCNLYSVYTQIWIREKWHRCGFKCKSWIHTWTKIKSPHPNMCIPKSRPKCIHPQKMLNLYDLCMKVMDRTRTWIYRAHGVDAAQMLGPYPILWREVGHTFSKFLENSKRSIGAYFHTIQSSYCSCRSSPSVVSHIPYFLSHTCRNTKK